MKIGVPKEIKRHEYRVGMTPGCAKGMNTYKGYCVHSRVAKSLGLDYEALDHLLN